MKIESITLESSTLHNANPLSMTPNSKGEYNIVFGAFNVYSLHGHFYDINNDIRDMFNSGSELQNRISIEDVTPEVNHPPYKQGMNIDDYVSRLSIIDSNNTCGIITSLSLDSNPTYVSFQREPLYLVKGSVKPDGNYGELLEKSFRDPNKDTAFSLRGLNYVRKENGITIKTVHTIIDYDFVKLPGIRVAKKSEWGKFSLESAGIEIALEDIDGIISHMERDGISTESHSGIITGLKDIKNQCNDKNCIYQW